MLPIPDKSWIIAEYLENWYDIKDGHAYIVLTQDEGIVFKVAINQLRKTKTITLKSLNPAYSPYEVPVNEVREVWKFCNYMSSELPDNSIDKDEMLAKLIQLEWNSEGM